MTKVHQKKKNPENWRRLTLDNCGTWIGGGTPLKSNPDYWIDGNVPWATSQDITEPILTSTTYKITEQAVKETTTNVIPKNSIILVMRSGILRRKFPVTKTISDVAINQDLRALIPNNDVSFDYLYNFMIHNEKKILETCVKVGTTVESVEFNFLKKFDIQLPPMEEQKKIASILSTWDKAIKLKEKLIEQKKEQKKGLMQKLLTGEVRLPGFDNGKWEKYMFGNIVTNKSKSFNPTTENEIYKCIELEHIDSDTATVNGFSFSNETKSMKNIFNLGDILFGKLRPYLRKYWQATFNGVCSSEIWVLKPLDSSILTTNYLKYIVQTDSFITICNKTSGSKMPRADWSHLSGYHFKLPSLDEQHMISQLLNTIDKQINFMSDEVQELKKQKRGLMQNLLTGKIRVKV